MVREEEPSHLEAPPPHFALKLRRCVAASQTQSGLWSEITHGLHNCNCMAMRILTSAEFQSFVGANQAAAVHFDADWDINIPAHHTATDA